MNDYLAKTEGDRPGEPAGLLRCLDWLRLKMLGEDDLPVDPEDPEVIKLMAHQRSFLM